MAKNLDEAYWYIQNHDEGEVTGDELRKVRRKVDLWIVPIELDDQGRLISYEEYFPFGGSAYQAVASQTQTPKRYRFTSKERDDETGLLYFGARYYAPWLGRWTSADPSGISDGLNPYVYCSDSPVQKVDPDGRFDFDFGAFKEGLKEAAVGAAIGVGVVLVVAAAVVAAPLVLLLYPSTPIQFSVNQQIRELSLPSMLVDRIMTVGRPLHTLKDVPAVRQWFQDAENGLQGVLGPQTTDSDSRQEILWRTLIGNRSMKIHPAPVEFGNYFHVWRAFLKNSSSGGSLSALSAAEIRRLAQLVDPGFDPKRKNPDSVYLVLDGFFKYRNQWGMTCLGRSFCTTTQTVGIVPPKTLPGDIVCIVYGMQTPYIVRPSGDQSGKYRLVGECYMHGMMNGEMLDTGVPELIRII